MRCCSIAIKHKHSLDSLDSFFGLSEKSPRPQWECRWKASLRFISLTRSRWSFSRFSFVIYLSWWQSTLFSMLWGSFFPSVRRTWDGVSPRSFTDCLSSRHEKSQKFVVIRLCRYANHRAVCGPWSFKSLKIIQKRSVDNGPRPRGSSRKCPPLSVFDSAYLWELRLAGRFVIWRASSFQELISTTRFSEPSWQGRARVSSTIVLRGAQEWRVFSVTSRWLRDKRRRRKCNSSSSLTLRNALVSSKPNAVYGIELRHGSSDRVVVAMRIFITRQSHIESHFKSTDFWNRDSLDRAKLQLDQKFK